MKACPLLVIHDSPRRRREMLRRKRYIRGGYCGPSALSACTGETVERIEDHLNWVRGNPAHTSVVGVPMHQMPAVAKRLGWELKQVYTRDDFGNGKVRRLSLAGWLETHRENGSKYIVTLPDHYIAVQGEWMADNHRPAGLPLAACHRLRSHVVRVWMVKKEEKTS